MNQEPIGWITHESFMRLHDGGNSKGSVPIHAVKNSVSKIPVYVEPPKFEWVDLTDDEIQELHTRWNDEVLWDGWNYERAIEAKLKEKNT